MGEMRLAFCGVVKMVAFRTGKCKYGTLKQSEGHHVVGLHSNLLVMVY